MKNTGYDLTFCLTSLKRLAMASVCLISLSRAFSSASFRSSELMASRLEWMWVRMQPPLFGAPGRDGNGDGQ